MGGLGGGGPGWEGEVGSRMGGLRAPECPDHEGTLVDRLELLGGSDRVGNAGPSPFLL